MGLRLKTKKKKNKKEEGGVVCFQDVSSEKRLEIVVFRSVRNKLASAETGNQHLNVRRLEKCLHNLRT